MLTDALQRAVIAVADHADPTGSDPAAAHATAVTAAFVSLLVHQAAAHGVPGLLDTGWPGGHAGPAATADEALASLDAQPLESVAAAHQTALAWQLVHGPGGWGVQPHPTRRKRSGSFYTPAPLAQRLVERTLDGWTSPDGEPVRVIDPAVGTGVFLLVASDALVAAGHDRAALARDSLHGVDLDPLAVAIAQALLWIRAGGGQEVMDGLRAHIVVGDSLIGAAPPRAPQADEATRVDGVPALHWPAVFPDAFEAGGFDLVIGNPPWDKIKPFAREFFATHHPGIVGLGRAAFNRESARLLTDDRQLAAAFDAYRQQMLARASAVRTSRAYRLQGRGDANTYKAFVERALYLVHPRGRVGLVLPYSVCIDLGSSDLRREIFTSRGPVFIEVRDNRSGAFGDISSMVNWSLLVCGGGADPVPRITVQVGDHTAPMPLRLLELVSPDSLSVPRVTDKTDVRLLEAAYANAPLLGGGGAPGGWTVAWRREFDLTIDQPLFREQADGPHSAPRSSPLFEGKMIHQYRLDWAGRTRDGSAWIKENPPTTGDGLPLPRYYVAAAHVAGRFPDGPDYRCALRLIQNSRNRRTLIATVLPPTVVAGNSLATASVSPLPPDRASRLRQHLLLCGLLNSFVMDRLVRYRIDANLNMFHLAQLPLPPGFASDDESAALSLEIGPRVLALLVHHAPRAMGALVAAVTEPDDAWSAAAATCLQKQRPPAEQRAAIDQTVVRAWKLSPSLRDHVAAGFTVAGPA